jgi:hypothetical protein
MLRKIFLTSVLSIGIAMSCYAFGLIPQTNKKEVKKNPELDKVVIDGIYYDWIVYYTNVKDEEKQCYMVAFAKKQEGNYKKSRKPFISITIFKSKNTEEFSVFADYQFKIKSAIYLGIGNRQFRLFTNDKYAWTKNGNEDSAIIQNLMDVNLIKIRGETITGEYTIDSYELKGIARAYKKIHELCR